MQEPLTRQELAEWSNNPITRKVRRYLKDHRQSIIDSWADGNLLHHTAESQLCINAEAIATCKILQDLYELEFKTVADFYGWENGETEKEEEVA